jgi:hypothetical protein
MINFNGIWQNEISKELICITGPNNGDEYLIEYNWSQDRFKNLEKVEIFISNNDHARLLKSEKFRFPDIWILSEDKIKLDNIIYFRKK